MNALQKKLDRNFSLLNFPLPRRTVKKLLKR
jgi:hypothetical protein